MGNYTIFLKFENPRRGRQARNFSENYPKILDLKSSSEQIIFPKLSLGAPEKRLDMTRYGIIDYVMSNFFPFMAKPDLTIFFFRSWHLEQIENICP